MDKEEISYLVTYQSVKRHDITDRYGNCFGYTENKVNGSIVIKRDTPITADDLDEIAYEISSKEGLMEVCIINIVRFPL